MTEYGSAITFAVILFIILVTGILYMCLTPLIDAFLLIGSQNGTDPQSLQVIKDALKTWTPIVITMSMIMYGWRKSGQNRIA